MPDWDHLVNRSPLTRIIGKLKNTWTRFNEMLLNIDTLEPISQAGNRSGEVSPYESPDYWYIRRICRMLRPLANQEAVFYDLGSGMGRILCLMARQPFKKVVGVELKADLCQIARENTARLRGKKAPVEVICADAAQADLSGGTIYFMFHPFGAETLGAVCRNLKESLAADPRRIIMIYYNAVHEQVLAATGWLEMFHHFNTLTGRRVSFWRSQPAVNVPSINKTE